MYQYISRNKDYKKTLGDFVFFKNRRIFNDLLKGAALLSRGLGYVLSHIGRDFVVISSSKPIVQTMQTRFL